MIWRCPSIRFLDYQKVKDKERKKATELFGTQENPSTLASTIMGQKSRTFDTALSTTGNGTADGKNYRVKLTPQERKRVEEMIRNAKSLQDIIKLEKELNEGRVPVGAQGDAMEE